MFWSAKPRFLFLALGWVLILEASCSKNKTSEGKIPSHLARVANSYGTDFQSEVTLRVQDRHLVLPSGKKCQISDLACTPELRKLAGTNVALELNSSLTMGELSEPLAALRTILGGKDTACLVVADSRSRRCIPFLPFGGDDFSEWLDADKPVGKIRVVMRGDGLEVVADSGKVPGPDRFGPSIPSLGAKPNYDRLDQIMEAMARRFPYENVAGLLPSAGMRVQEVARVMAMINGINASRFGTVILVYP